jgi:hypothetical protein
MTRLKPYQALEKQVFANKHYKAGRNHNPQTVLQAGHTFACTAGKHVPEQHGSTKCTRAVQLTHTTS